MAACLQVLLVGVPAVFPERGGTAQLFWALLVCFLSASFYMLSTPYVEDSDDQLAQLAQLQIYLTLLSSLALRAVPPSEAVGNMVTVILIAVPIRYHFSTSTSASPLHLCLGYS